MKIDTNLERAAQALNARLDLLEIPRSKLPQESWQAVDIKFPGLVPGWYKDLLANYAFMNVNLGLPRWNRNPIGAELTFLSPLDGFFEQEFEELAPKGWIPFAEEADGNLWAFRAATQCDSPIILIEQTGGGLDCDSGWYYAAHSLAHVISAASISECWSSHIFPTGRLDLSKAGYKMWGQQDSFLIRQDIIDPKEKIKES